MRYGGNTSCLEVTAGGRLLILDVRSDGEDPAPEIARIVYPLHDRSRIVVACEDRSLMDRLRAWQPDLPVAHALSTEGALRRYIQGRINGSLPPMPVIVPEALLHTPHELASLAARCAPGEWLRVSGFEESRLREGRFPTVAELDLIAGFRGKALDMSETGNADTEPGTVTVIPRGIGHSVITDPVDCQQFLRMNFYSELPWSYPTDVTKHHHNSTFEIETQVIKKAPWRS